MTSEPNVTCSVRWGLGRPLGCVFETVVLSLACLLWSSSALAEVDVQLELSADVIEVGQTVRVQAKAMSSEDSPGEPQLRVSKDFVLHGPSIGTNHQISFVNGRVQRLAGITATWELTARRSGEFTVGPASVSGPQGRVSSGTVRLKVVPAGSLPQRQGPRRPRGPFDDDDDDPFNLRGRSLLDDLLGRTSPSLPDAPPEYRLDRAPDEVAFLRAELSDTKVVLGEQVTLSVYAYGSRGRFREGNPREPRRTDFFSHPLVENSGRQRLYSVEIDGRRYQAVLIRRFALFPLKTGKLEIGPTEITFVGAGYRSRTSNDGIARTSNRLMLEVVEPPAQGRPPDYQAGDVGSFRLKAEVSPRQLKQGDSLSVVATLQGTGNLPARLVTPEQKGVEWLEPTLQEQIDTDRQNNVRGVRTFTYVVNVEPSGKIDLGELRLPYFDPNQKRYEVAQASLGSIEVAERVEEANDAPRQRTRVRLSERMAPRRQLEFSEPRTTRLTARPWFWWLCLGAPLAVALSGGLRTFWANWSQQRLRSKKSKARATADALNEAKDYSRAGDLKAASSAIERALFSGIEDKTAIRGRALLRRELTTKLIEVGVEEHVANDVEAIFVALDELRFAQESGQTEALVARTEKVLSQLNKTRTRSSREDDQ